MNQIEVLSVFVVASLCIVIFILNRLYEYNLKQQGLIESLIVESYKDKLLIAKLYEGSDKESFAEGIFGGSYQDYLSPEVGEVDIKVDEKGIYPA
jgi:hypothetical protein